MKYWSTSETSEDIGDTLSSFRRTIEVELNKLLENSPSEDDKYPTWAVIFVCVSDEFLDFFAETLVLRKKPPAIEHRLQINFHDFTSANSFGKVKLMIDVLRRSVCHMGSKKFNISKNRQNELDSMLDLVEKNICKELVN